MKILILIFITTLLVVGLFWTKPETHAELQSLSPSIVEVEIIKEIEIQPIVKVTGKLEPARKASLHFQVSGQINERFVEAGQKVNKNIKMLSINADDFVDTVEESKALLEIRRSTIERDIRLLELIKKERALQEDEVKRLEQLGQNSLSSKSNYDQALQALYRQQAEEARLNHSLGLARSELKVEQAKLNIAKRNLARTKLISPFSGTVNAVYAEVGDYVSPGQAAVEIIQLNELDLNLEINGRAASKLKLGQEITITTNNGNKLGGVLALALDPSPETNTHTMRIRLSSDGLFSGQLAIANIPGQYYEKANVISISSILHEDGSAYIFEIIGNNVFKKKVRLVDRYNDLQIIEGIAPGTSIVARDVSNLMDGQLIISN